MRPEQSHGQQWRISPAPGIVQDEKEEGVKEALRYSGERGCHVPPRGTNFKEKVSAGHPGGVR